MSKFFIHRLIFAWVIAIFVVLAGIVSITRLPVAQFPSVAPPTITVTATYPGATAQTLTDSVLQLIEREINGAEGLMYMSSSASATGSGELTVTFEPGTNPDLAQVDVQNRLARATPRLPSIVQSLGVRVDKSMSNFLMILTFQSDTGETSRDEISDYVNRNVVPEIQRLNGVGKAQLFAAGRARVSNWACRCVRSSTRTSMTKRSTSRCSGRTAGVRTCRPGSRASAITRL